MRLPARALVLAAALAAALIPPAAPAAAELVEETVRIPMPDGVRLEALFVAPAAAGRRPTILVRTPYSHRQHLDEARFWAESGYAVVAQDVRGKFGSEGVYLPFLNEYADGAATRGGAPAACRGKAGRLAVSNPEEESPMRTAKAFQLAALAATLAAPVSAGIVYEIEVEDHGASPSVGEATTVMVEGRRLAMTVAPIAPGKPGGKVYFDAAVPELRFQDDESRTWFPINEESLAALGGMAAQMAGAIEQALANVPESQKAAVREMMEKRMPQAQPAPIRSELRKTGERGEMAGYPCVRYDVVRGGEKIRELWVTDWSNVEGGKEVADLFGELGDFMRRLTDAFSAASGMPAPGLDDNAFEFIRELGGFPVVTREFEGGELDEEATLRSSARRTLDPAEFEPPAGYKRRSIFPGG